MLITYNKSWFKDYESCWSILEKLSISNLVDSNYMINIMKLTKKIKNHTPFSIFDKNHDFFNGIQKIDNDYFYNKNIFFLNYINLFREEIYVCKNCIEEGGFHSILHQFKFITHCPCHLESLLISTNRISNFKQCNFFNKDKDVFPVNKWSVFSFKINDPLLKEILDYKSNDLIIFHSKHISSIESLHDIIFNHHKFFSYKLPQRKNINTNINLGFLNYLFIKKYTHFIEYLDNHFYKTIYPLNPYIKNYLSNPLIYSYLKYRATFEDTQHISYLSKDINIKKLGISSLFLNKLGNGFQNHYNEILIRDNPLIFNLPNPIYIQIIEVFFDLYLIETFEAEINEIFCREIRLFQSFFIKIKNENLYLHFK